MTLDRREHVQDATHELQNFKQDLISGGTNGTKLDIAAMRAKDTIHSVLHQTAGANDVDLTSEASIADLRASGTVQVATQPADAEWVDIDGIRYTFVAGLSSVRRLIHTGGANVPIGADVNATAANLNEALNLVNGYKPFGVTGTVSTDTVTVTAKQEGTVGNAKTLVDGTGGNLMLSGATLAGGSDTGGIVLSTTDTTGDDLLVKWYQKQHELSPA